MDEMDETLQGLEKHLEPYFKASLRETKSNLSDLQIAKLNIVIAYSINTLFYSMFCSLPLAKAQTNFIYQCT
jgi:hypothetical protein